MSPEGKGGPVVNRVATSLVLAVLSIALACGGGGGGGPDPTDGGSGALAANFVPDQPSPGLETVSMGLDGAIGDVVTLRIRVTETQAVYGAAFDLVYDPTFATFLTWAPGTFLEAGGQTPNYAVNSPQPGRVVVGVSRLGDVPGVDAAGTRTLVKLTFRIRKTGSSQATFQAASLSDDQIPPGDISGLTWAGGSFTGS